MPWWTDQSHSHNKKAAPWKNVENPPRLSVQKTEQRRDSQRELNLSHSSHRMVTELRAGYISSNDTSRLSEDMWESGIRVNAETSQYPAHEEKIRHLG